MSLCRSVFCPRHNANAFGLYPESLTADELARYFHLDDDDRNWIATKRRDSSRLGYALQMTTVRFLGTFLEDPTAVPESVLRNLATQLHIVEFAECISTYRATRQRWQHTVEIRARLGFSRVRRHRQPISPWAMVVFALLDGY